MKKSTLITLFTAILFFGTCQVGWGQIAAWQLNGALGSEATIVASTLDANLNSSSLSRGAGLAFSGLANTFSSTNFTASGTKADAITANKFVSFTVNAKTGYKVSLSTLDARFRRSSTGPNAFRWQYSTDGSTFTDFGSADISYTLTTTGGDAQTQISLSSITALQDVTNATTITIRLLGWGASATTGTFAIGRSLTTGVTDFSLAIGGTVAAAGGSTPVISVTPSTLTGFTYFQGSGPSTEKTFAISGSDLTADISIAPPTNYEISKTTGGSFSATNPITLTQSGGTVGATDIYVRLKAGLNAGNYNSEAITASSTDATNKTVTCSGSVTIGEPTNHVTSFASAAGTPPQSAIVLTWADATGVTVPAGYLIKGSAVSYAAITDPVDGTPETDAGLVKNISAGVQTHTYTGLTVNTPYYFKIYSYTNSGVTINYKIDGTIPQTTKATDIYPTLPITENFEYATGQLTDVNGGANVSGGNWVSYSGTTLPIMVTGGSLSYPGYAFSGIGNKVGLIQGSAEDAYRQFAPQGIGTKTYAGFLMNVTTTTGLAANSSATGDYTVSFMPGTSTSILVGRVSLRAGSVANTFNIGLRISSSNSVAAWSASDYPINAPVLIVFSYEIITGDANDISNVWINPVLGGIEPTADLTQTSALVSDPIDIARITLRQGTNSFPGEIDGIRISNNWADIVGAIITWPTTSFWTGANSSNWFDASNWSSTPAGGYPGATTNVTINAISVIGFYPTLTSAATCASLTIENTASFIGSEYLTVTGATTVKRSFSGGVFHLFCLPFSGGIANASPTFDLAYLDKYVESGGAWTRLTNVDPVESGRGYSINYLSDKTLSFIGALNKVNQVFGPLSYTGAATGYGPGWHLLGNPFTSAVNLTGFTSDNVDSYIYVWNGSQYLTGPSQKPNEGSYTYGTLTGNIVPAMQGFFVHATADAASLTIPLTARVHSTQPFYKSAEAAPKDALFLTVEGNGYNDKAIVAFNPEATAGFDNRFDAYKLFGISAAPQLYSILPGNIATVNSLPSVATTERVPLGLKVGNANTYTLTVSGIGSFDASVPISLVDTKLGITQDLRLNSTYSFTAAPGDAENRFNLSFAAITGIDKPVAGDFRIFASRGLIHINQAANAKGTVYVYTAAGQLVAKSSLTPNETLLRVNAQGVYFIKVITDKTTFSTKVVLSQPW